ncbi:MAG: ABC-2 transporter permease [Clostridiales bacterium]|nr:ABC-2 transporter permease [Clostridiales bacterium]
MSNSLKMARLDYFAFKSQIAAYAALILMIIMFAVMSSSFVTLIITVSWFTALLLTNIFAIQEKNELERLYAALSLNAKNIICGRYIFTFVNYILAMIVSIFIGIVISFLQNRDVNYADIILGISISLFAFTIIIGIQIPIYFKLGYTKARVWCMLPFVLIMAICILPSFIDVFSSIVIGLLKNQIVLEIMSLLISFVIIPVSYHLSVICCQKRR